MTTPYRYRAISKRGNPLSGALSKPPSVRWVESRFRYGWLFLSVRDANGTEVAFIGRQDDGRRVWWAEESP